LSTDPLSKSYPWYTPYQFAGNKPIIAIDIDGKEELIVTNFYIAGGQLYKTEIQVTNAGDISLGENTKQVVHFNRVDILPTGDATVSYLGSVAGTRARNATAGSSALPVTLNSILWSQSLFIYPIGSGKIVQQTTFFGESHGYVEWVSTVGAQGASVAEINENRGIGGNLSSQGLIEIDWVAKAADGKSPAPGADIAPNGVADQAPNPANTVMLARGINNTPIGVANLQSLLPGVAVSMGITGVAVNPSSTNTANFSLSPNHNGSFSAGLGQKTLGGPGSAAQSGPSQAVADRGRGGSNFTVTPQ